MMPRPRRTTLAALVAGIGIALASGGVSLLVWGGRPGSAMRILTDALPPPAPLASDTHHTAPAAPPIRIDVPAIDLTSSLVDLRLQDDGTLQVPGDPAQAGWWSGGTAPGDPGPAVIVGHVDSLHGPAAFYRLAALRPGDKIVIGRADGSSVTFSVDALREYPKAAFPTDLVYGPTDGPTLRLLTCGGSFDHATGHYTDNLVVFAHEATAESPMPTAPSAAPAPHEPAGGLPPHAIHAR